MEILVKVEDLARSLFREFLLKNSLHKTLETFNEEDKRFRPKITKIDLIKYLAIEKLIRINKEKSAPHNTLLEIIVDYLHGKFKQRFEKNQSQINKSEEIIASNNTFNENSKNTNNNKEISYSSKDISEFDSKPKENKIKSFVFEENNEKNSFENKIINSDLNLEGSEGQMTKKKTRKKPKPIINNDENAGKKETKKDLPPLSKPNKQMKPISNLQEENKNEDLAKSLTKKNSNSELRKKINDEEDTIKEKNTSKTEIFDSKKKNFQNQENEGKNKESKEIEEKIISDELDEFDEVFNFGIKSNETSKPSNKSITKIPSKKKIPEEIKNNSDLENDISNKTKEKIKLDLINGPIELPSNIINENFDYMLKSKLMMKSQLKQKSLTPFTKEIRDDLRKLLFGDSLDNKNLPKSWQQGFYFSDNPSLFFGLFQKEGGPCGVLACVQAYLIKHLIFLSKNLSKSDRNTLNLIRSNCLLLSLSEILFKCAPKSFSNSKQIKLVQSETNSLSLENCSYMSYEIKDVNELYSILQNHKDDFIGQFNNGVAFFLYSIILTKGIDKFREEMDIKENNIIGLHSTCTQEIVNLILTGEATSNCIDGYKEVDSDYKIKGVKEKSEFGFLTILEYYNYTKVEKNFKEPKFPIWVVSIEYHYCICFSCDFSCINDKKDNFEIVFYDGLNHPNDFIVLEIGNSKVSSTSNKENENLPLMNMVLFTKWGKERDIIWKGYDPIF